LSWHRKKKREEGQQGRSRFFGPPEKKKKGGGGKRKVAHGLAAGLKRQQFLECGGGKRRGTVPSPTEEASRADPHSTRGGEREGGLDRLSFSMRWAALGKKKKGVTVLS